MTQKEFKIEGMSCGHCVMAVKKELQKIENLKIDNVEIGSAKVEFDESKLNNQKIIDAIEEAGYKVISN
jgi:copper chaperone